MVQGIKRSLKGKEKPRYQSFVHSTVENNFAATRLFFFVALIKGKTGTALLKIRRANRSKGLQKIRFMLLLHPFYYVTTTSCIIPAVAVGFSGVPSQHDCKHDDTFAERDGKRF